jgi:predicted Ser/Thr protein kinase
MSHSETIRNLSDQIQKYHDVGGNFLGFYEYVELVNKDPMGQCRSAAQYIRDTFDYFKNSTINYPTGKVKRYNLFDAEFADGIGKVAGQEEAQEAIYRYLNNFVRQGRVNRLVLLHGPNGSAKTSIIRAIVQAMEHYSSVPEGAQYKFRWLFPKANIARSNIGFGDRDEPLESADLTTFAHLPGEDLDAVLECQLKDHPLLLIPKPQRKAYFEKLKEQGSLAGDFQLSDYLLHGDLCPQCRQIHDSLLAAYGGDSSMVLRHIQVLRLHHSQRYRQCVASIDPQMHVDAGEQQLTASRGLTSLPPAIAHLTLYQLRGPLIDANRGLLEFNDLLKRPIDSFKYLLTTCESGQVTLERSTLFLDTVFLGSTNEMLLDSFKSYADFASFKGRLELIRVPYLRRVSEERQIYQDQFITSALERHLSPHTLHLAAFWAVLSRLRRPQVASFGSDLSKVVEKLTPIEKAMLYDTGETPSQISSSTTKEILSILPEIYKLQGQDYEGRTGASAREVRMLLMNAAQQNDRQCVSPLSLIEEIRSLVSDKDVFEFLKLKAEGDYLDQDKIIDMIETVYLDLLEDEAAEALGLVSQASYDDLFNKYIQHVVHWQKKSKVKDPITGDLLPPDEDLMKDVEKVIRPEKEEIDKFRKGLISRIGAFALDSKDSKDTKDNDTPESALDYSKVFPSLYNLIKDDFFATRRDAIQKNYNNFLQYMNGEDLEEKEMKTSEQMKETMLSRFNYCEHCAKEAVSYLLKKRYQ